MQTLGFDNTERHKFSLLHFCSQMPPSNWYEALKESYVRMTVFTFTKMQMLWLTTQNGCNIPTGISKAITVLGKENMYFHKHFKLMHLLALLKT